MAITKKNSKGAHPLHDTTEKAPSQDGRAESLHATTDGSARPGCAPQKGSTARLGYGLPGKHGYGPRRGEDVPLGGTVPAGKFGRMFPDLRPLVPDPEALLELGRAMVQTVEQSNDPALDNGPSGTHPGIPAGFTYFGQFLDHDITFDPTSIQDVLVDPQALRNFRTPKLDLDSVYGAGPVVQPYLYERPGAATPEDPFAPEVRRLLIGNASATSSPAGTPKVKGSLPNDLPRGPHGFALTGDPRNDENLAVAQHHLAFLKFHNAIVTGMENGSVPRLSPLRKSVFDEARDLMIWHYQRIVLDDFLARILDPEILDRVKTEGPRYFKPGKYPFIPIEFSAAAYRFGHSMVREEYEYNEVFRRDGLVSASLALLFRFSGLSGSGEDVPIPSNWIIDWRRFYSLGMGADTNASRLIDPFLTNALGQIPDPSGAFTLAGRNLLRGRSLGLPPGQSVARFLDELPLEPEEFTGPDGDVARAHGFDLESPLWYYILKEAEVRAGGRHLGRVGSIIVAEVFVTLLRSDPGSFWSRKHSWDWEPTLPHEFPGEYRMTDLLRFVDDIDPIGKPENQLP